MFPASRLPEIPAPCHSTAPPKANLGPDTLLELSDSVRESLAKQGDFGPDANRLSFFLHLALVEEENGIRSIDFETIKAARLDKLVAELTEWGEMAGDLLPRYVHDVVTAMRLEEMWRARFRIDYSMIDEIRAHELAVKWQLRERPAWRGSMTTLTSLVMGGPTPGVGREGEGNCEPGAWWLDIACARLDGVVGTEHETTSRGNDKIPTMPLLTGTEFNIGHDRVRYLREGTGADMHPALIPQTGKFVRVLRGYQLQSRFAPVAGIRNDGLWKVMRYSHRLNKTTGRCHLEVDLEKAPDQPPMSELRKIPRPSHIDD